jgi:RNA polymerase sigma-70 factor (ECF subfamily)
MDGSAVDCYERYAAELTQFATVLVGPAAAEDVVADAVLSAFSAAAWPEVTAHRAYLYRSVLNRARQLQRADRRRVWRESAVARPDRVEAPTVRVEVASAMRALTVRQRAVVFLTYWLDLDRPAAAAQLGTSTRTVERELAAALRRLEGMLR